LVREQASVFPRNAVIHNDPRTRLPARYSR
jgi:hypothetical protein